MATGLGGEDDSLDRSRGTAYLGRHILSIHGQPNSTEVEPEVVCLRPPFTSCLPLVSIHTQ